ncbi:MAG: CBS domain-containing protein [Planctomycetota bacterium]|nr:CBS domain-containing protein [Planctomycetota bacterium]
MTDPLMKLAHDSLAVDVATSVADAVARMSAEGHGAVAVTEAGKLAGIFTERDLMEKVVRPGLDADATPIQDVMCTKPLCVRAGASRAEALEIMLKERFRHLPVCDEAGQPIAMLSQRDLLAHQIQRLRGEVDSLEAYLLADGPGGD